jgi:hypothetical protein
MQRIVILLSMVFCVTFVLVGVHYFSPRWTKKAGLDFWSLWNSATPRAEDEENRSKRLEYALERTHMRNERLDRITLDLCEYRSTLDEAIGLLVPIAQSEPEWYVQLQFECTNFGVSVSNDRDVLAYYLYIKIHGLHKTAKTLYDDTHTAAVAKRLAHLEIEIREQKKLPVPTLP